MSGGHWSDAEVARLKRKMKAGWTAAKIAKSLPGRSLDSIKTKISKLRLTGDIPPPQNAQWTNSEDRKLIAARNDGYGFWRIAEEVLPHRSQLSIEKRARRLVERGSLTSTPYAGRKRAVQIDDIDVDPKIYAVAHRIDASQGSDLLLRRMLQTGKHWITCEAHFRKTCAMVGLAA